MYIQGGTRFKIGYVECHTIWERHFSRVNCNCNMTVPDPDVIKVVTERLYAHKQMITFEVIFHKTKRLMN